jgi:phosphatidylserine/phosphatidylglycerophosphate/cardiolipin synthase-like enzyme
MHNKFLVKFTGGVPSDVLMGSANFTTEGLATQANVLHTFHSPELAKLYLERKNLLAGDPTLAKTAKGAAWSQPATVGNAKVRLFLSPEPSKDRSSIDQVVSSVKSAKKSVLFCLFSPTDAQLRDAIFDAGDAGKMMFGLVNSISSKQADGEDGGNAGDVAKVEIFSRSRDKKDVYSHSLYAKNDCPEGFWNETSSLPGKAAKFPVYIHHKFIVIDAETDNPVAYSGSANMSGNSVHKNDENLLEIRGSRELAAVYLAEFFRLYEHYKARAIWNLWKEAHDQGKKFRRYELNRTGTWKKKYYDPQTPEYKSRISMAS